MNAWTLVIALVVVVAAYDAGAMDRLDPRNIITSSSSSSTIEDAPLDYGRAFVDLVLTDPLLARSPLGKDNGGKAHFDKMAVDIERAVDESGKRELLEWAKRASAEEQDFFFNGMFELVTSYPGAGEEWILEHIHDPEDQFNFSLLRNLYWITFTRLMDMNNLCEPMELGPRMRCYLAFADLLGMQE